MKNVKVLGGLAILLFIVSGFVGNVFAQTRTPGVSVGDNFKYTFVFSTDMNSSETVLPDFLQSLASQVDNIDWVQITVTGVSGTSVSAQVVMQFKNGTQQSSTGVVDVATGGGNFTSEGDLTSFLIASNLNAGDQVYLGGSAGTINETVTMAYLSESRQVNHQRVTMNYDVSQAELSGFNITGSLQQSNTEDIYWDRQTGALVKMSYNMTTRSTQINGDISLNVNLIESNVYTIPEYPAMLTVLVALVVSAIALIVVYKRAPLRPSLNR